MLLRARCDYLHHHVHAVKPGLCKLTSSYVLHMLCILLSRKSTAQEADLSADVYVRFDGVGARCMYVLVAFILHWLQLSWLPTGPNPAVL